MSRFDEPEKRSVARRGSARLPVCPVCGLCLTWPEANGICPNRWCRRPDREFSAVYSLGVHEGALRHALLRYKYHAEWWWARQFAGLVARYLESNSTWFEEFSLIAAVPTYLGPGSRRLWDPVGEILSHLADRLRPSWEVNPKLVLKVNETPPMQGLGWASRQTLATTAIRSSLKVPCPEPVAGARVLVFDDVMTEGSTMREVARALRLAGAAETAGLVLARPTWSERRETQRPTQRS